MKAFKVNRNEQDYYRVDLPPRLFLDGKRRSAHGQDPPRGAREGRTPHRQAQRASTRPVPKPPSPSSSRNRSMVTRPKAALRPRNWQGYNAARVKAPVNISDVMSRSGNFVKTKDGWVLQRDAALRLRALISTRPPTRPALETLPVVER